MTFAIVWGLIALVAGTAFVLVWWKVADGWAGEKHRRFKERPDDGPAPTVVRRVDVEDE